MLPRVFNKGRLVKCNSLQNFRLIQIESICRRQIKFEKLILVLLRVENIVRKGENAGYQHFLLFTQCFQKPSHSGLLKIEIEWQSV